MEREREEEIKRKETDKDIEFYERDKTMAVWRGKEKKR